MKRLEIRLLFIFLFSAFSIFVSGQEKQEESLLKGRTIYHHEYAFGAQVYSNGFAINGYYGKHKNYTDRNIYFFEIATLNHKKEIRSHNLYSDGRSYFFGKDHSVLLFKAGYGKHKILYEKFRSRAVAIGYTWSIGPSLALLKPIYLEVQEPGTRLSATERFDPERHYQIPSTTGPPLTNISGRAPWMRGLEEASVMPSIFMKAGLMFENSPEDEGLRALELGVTLDLFPKEVPIMAFDVNSFYYFGLYLTIRYGKKENV